MEYQLFLPFKQKADTTEKNIRNIFSPLFLPFKQKADTTLIKMIVQSTC